MAASFSETEMLEGALSANTKTITDHLTKEIEKVTRSLGALERKLGDVISTQESHAAEINQLQKDNSALHAKLEDMENRDRRSNLRFRGLPEHMEDVKSVVTALCQELLPGIAIERLELDRVHRALGPRKPPEEPPRDILAKFHFYNTKEQVMRAARDTVNLSFQGHKFQLFPVCKTRVTHGTNSHKMAIIFNKGGLRKIQLPCVIQSFISHNAVLYKVFVIGDSYTVVERPSLKNFSTGASVLKAFFFLNVSIISVLSSPFIQLDKVEGVFERPNDDVIRAVSKALRKALGISLFGIDIIINNKTGQHAVIDINAFPGYEGVPEFFGDLLNHITTLLPPSSILGERLSCASATRMESPWVVEGEANGSVKLQSQRFACNSSVSTSFQQHCVTSLATKASSQ
ncbi:LOW QUALITY PROTEIN: inositol-tetrakisphosphate 1-kinase-like [Gastrophryne carolinensis]